MRVFGKLILLLFFNILALNGWSQSCTTLGQTVYSAFPVCGQSVFEQKNVPTCQNGNLPATICAEKSYADANPYWYKFTCFTSGTLSFLIAPKQNTDDYDWELFDITGHDPGDVYTNATLVVAYNWSGVTGNTGAGSQGTSLFACSSNIDANGNPISSLNPFSSMPTIVQGHNYLLVISHFSGSNQSGYDLSFQEQSSGQGGTAVITDPSTPAMQNAYGVCDGTAIVVVLNKNMKCNSLAADGSDFTVSGPVPISVVSATGNGCSSGFDMDSVTLKLNRILAPGTYTVTAATGTDGNTLFDNCGTALAPGSQVSLKFVSAQATPMDSISPVICIQDTLQLVFSKPMLCSSIAADGSDFIITGPAAVTVKSASGICNNGVTTIIKIILTKPIRLNGTFTITLQNGSDGNSLIDECNQVTPAGSTLSFTTKNITTADFQTNVNPGCKYDSVYLTHNGYGGTTQWLWSIDGLTASNIQNPVLISNAFGTHTVQLAVTNGFCSDTASSSFTFTDQTVKASFAVSDTLCPTDTLHFEDRSTSNTIAWKWTFGNGVTSTLQFPPAQNYPLTGRRAYYTTSLIATNRFCSDTTYKIITVLASCYIAVPSAFTPNGDGLNDYLYPLNAFKADNLVFRVFNRYGQIVFETRDWTKKWDGRVNALPQPSGTYVWMLDYTNHDTGQKVSLKGTTVLIR